MKNLEIKKEIKKMSIANIDGKLTPEEMENIMAGSHSKSFNWATAGFCVSTVILLSSTLFAPLAAATGIGCGLGIYAGCGK